MAGDEGGGGQVPHHLHQQFARVGGRVLQASFRLPGQALDAGPHLGGDEFGNSPVHPFLAAEVVGKGRLVHPGGGGQHAGGDAVVAVAAEEGQAGGQEPFPGVVAVQFGQFGHGASYTWVWVTDLRKRA